LLLPGSGLDSPNGIVFDGGENIYVASVGTDSVIKYSLRTGLPVLEFSGGGLDGPDGVLLGGSVLLVSSYVNDSVKEFDLATAEWTRDLVSSGSGGLDGPAGLTRAANGNLLVASLRTDQVLEYDAETGDFVRVAAEGDGLDGPEGLALDAEGNLLVASFYTSAVLEYAPDGTFLGSFVPSASGGLWGAYGLAWGLNGNLLVASHYTDRILEYNQQDGSFVGEFAIDGGLDTPTHLVAATWGDLDGDGDIDLSDLAQLLAHYDTASGAAYIDGDLDWDGDVDLADLAALLAVYGTTCD
jgi:DNA-binding beta-propeller fold protein YncE